MKIKRNVVFVGLGLLLFWYFLLRPIASIVLNRAPTSSVIGDLGGVPVSIPREYTRFVEYDADPGFGEKRTSPKPERTYQSRLRSFGFDVRYPDMASVKAKTKEERIHKDIYTTMWMSVSVSTGEDYGGRGDKNLTFRLARNLDPKRKDYIYVPLPKAVYGLTAYTPTGPSVDKALRVLNRSDGKKADLRDRNIYHIQSESGHVSTFIECSNMTHAAAPCRHDFNLSPLMDAHISVRYRIGFLPHWQKIQSDVSNLIYSFNVDLPIETEQLK